MKIVITGASGFIGGHLAAAAAARGDEVVGIDRRTPERTTCGRIVLAGLGDRLEADVFRDADLVVHAAHDPTPGALEANVAGTMAWFRQARETGARAQLFLTSVSAHSDSPSEYGLAKHRLETFFIGEKERVLRAGLVAGSGGVFGSIVNAVRKLPVVPVPGGRVIRVSLTDVRTLTGVILDFQTLGTGRVYNILQPESVRLADLARAARAFFGTRGPVVSLPLGLSKILLSLAGGLLGSSSLSADGFRALEQSQTYGYMSDYPELGLPVKSLEQMLEETFGPVRKERE